jgi:hypothetical protein
VFVTISEYDTSADFKFSDYDELLILDGYIDSDVCREFNIYDEFDTQGSNRSSD